MLIYSLAQAEVIVPALRKPSRGLGMLLGGSAKRKLDSDRRVCSVQQYGITNCSLVSLSICFPLFLNIIDTYILKIKTTLQAVVICLHFNSISNFYSVCFNKLCCEFPFTAYFFQPHVMILLSLRLSGSG